MFAVRQKILIAACLGWFQHQLPHPSGLLPYLFLDFCVVLIGKHIVVDHLWLLSAHAIHVQPGLLSKFDGHLQHCEHGVHLAHNDQAAAPVRPLRRFPSLDVQLAAQVLCVCAQSLVVVVGATWPCCFHHRSRPTHNYELHAGLQFLIIAFLRIVICFSQDGWSMPTAVF